MQFLSNEWKSNKCRHVLKNKTRVHAKLSNMSLSIHIYSRPIVWDLFQVKFRKIKKVLLNIPYM